METGFSKTDWAVTLSKGIVGWAPFVGPLIAEVIGATIPNQRLDRIGRLMQELNARVGGIERERVEARFNDPEFVDLLEDGMVEASRSLEQTRIEYVAAMLKNSIQDEELKRLRDKRLMALLGELNDLEILLLASYTKAKQEDTEFQERHRTALRPPPPATFGGPKVDWDDTTMYEEQRNHLLRLGLLKIRFKKPKRGELPEFDENTGAIKASGRDITQLGRMLLRRIDVLQPEEF